jgi:hypothetical protein
MLFQEAALGNAVATIAAINRNLLQLLNEGSPQREGVLIEKGLFHDGFLPNVRQR